ncbi:MAG TPA: hypothetical protein VJP45_01690 [Candidatus Limnocylindria bacterium]|nr:hypothetical protein [Candidatus Limnocylindria bacterium]
MQARIISGPPALLPALIVAAAACVSATDPLPGFVRAAGEERASLVRAVADYYTVRGRAFVSGHLRDLYVAYPKLAQGEDIREGINLDAHHFRQWREVDASEAAHQLEAYEPMRIFVNGDRAVAFVHGTEMFEIRGGPSGGEFFTRIDLARDAGRWIVERTDEQMMAEPPPRIPDR